MKILTYTNNTNFTSRNATIRFADDIARKVNVEFPHISSSHVEDFMHLERYPKLSVNLWNKTSLMRCEMVQGFKSASNFVETIDVIINNIRKFKMANCGETGFLATIIAKINGIKNCYPASIKNPFDDDFDHGILYVEDEKPYIIDSWLGFADYLPQAKQRYKNQFCAAFDFEELGTKMIFKPNESIYGEFLSNDFKEENIAEIKAKYPELVIQK